MVAFGKKRNGKKRGKGKKPIKEYLPWNEKFRPKTLDEVAYQTDVVSALRMSLESANLPHLLFYGPPGTGKTSTILAVSRELYGPALMKNRVLELNASDERGINVIRHKVKNFARITVGITKDHDPKYPCPPYKIIILDEADSMTRDAQSALRRTMEKWSKVTRFCLICNYVSRILAPVASRCAKFRFQSLPSEHIARKLRYIAEAEKITVDDDTIVALEEVSGGDMRKAITFLQSAALMVPAGEKVMSRHVREVTVRIPDHFVETVFQACFKNFADIYDCAKLTIQEGYPVNMMLEGLQSKIINSDMSDLAKARSCMAVSIADTCLEDGANEFLQLLRVLCVIHPKSA